MFKTKKSRTILVLLALVLTLSGTVFAKQINETAEIFYNNIKLYIDGAEIVPKDANGNIAEPFTMNGTTYLPVRAISDAFGQDVEWDGETFSIYIGKKDRTKPDNRLDKIQYNHYERINNGDSRANFYKIEGNITDCSGNTYTNGLVFSGFNNTGHKITFPLNLQYKNLKGTIVIPKYADCAGIETKVFNSENTNWDVNIYCDNKLTKTVTAIPTWAYDIDLDVTGVNNISFELVNTHGDYIALTDLALYK